jgi:hypothetical protein
VVAVDPQLRRFGGRAQQHVRFELSPCRAAIVERVVERRARAGWEVENDPADIASREADEGEQATRVARRTAPGSADDTEEDTLPGVVAGCARTGAAPIDVVRSRENNSEAFDCRCRLGVRRSEDRERAIARQDVLCDDHAKLARVELVMGSCERGWLRLDRLHLREVVAAERVAGLPSRYTVGPSPAGAPGSVGSGLLIGNLDVGSLMRRPVLRPSEHEEAGGCGDCNRDERHRKRMPREETHLRGIGGEASDLEGFPLATSHDGQPSQ